MGLSQECRGRWRDLTGEDGGRGHERILCKAEPQVLGTVGGGEQQGGEGGAWCWLRSLAGGEEGGPSPGRPAGLALSTSAAQTRFSGVKLPLSSRVSGE